MKHRGVHTPHAAGLYKLDRLADETVALAEQIKAQVQQLRDENDDDTGDRDDDDE